MRVIGGEFRSRRLKSIPGLATRPTPDRLRETLFNVLAPRIVGAVFVDAYAGTGAVGIEALSRGAARCVFIESGRRAVEAIRENLHALGIEDRASVVAGKAAAALGRQATDIVFIDPPYEMEAEYAAALGQSDAALAIAQHSVRFDPGDAHGGLRRVRVLKQGDNALSFYERLKDMELHLTPDQEALIRQGIQAADRTELSLARAVIPISTLAPEPYQLLRDIPAVVEGAGDGFIATFFDANISTSGDTEEEAVSNLRSLILDTFEYLDSETSDALGPEPTRQLAVLRVFLRRTS